MGRKLKTVKDLIELTSRYSKSMADFHEAIENTERQFQNQKGEIRELQ